MKQIPPLVRSTQEKEEEQKMPNRREIILWMVQTLPHVYAVSGNQYLSAFLAFLLPQPLIFPRSHSTRMRRRSHGGSCCCCRCLVVNNSNSNNSGNNSSVAAMRCVRDRWVQETLLLPRGHHLLQWRQLRYAATPPFSPIYVH